MITALELAIHRGCPEDKLTMGNVQDTGIAFMGGCRICAASIACYNAYPSRDGYWRCKDCIDENGYDTVEQANAHIFDE